MVRSTPPPPSKNSDARLAACTAEITLFGDDLQEIRTKYRGADVVSSTRKETSYSDQTLTFANHSKTKKNQKVVLPTRSPRRQ